MDAYNTLRPQKMVTVVNRTSKKLPLTWDGYHYWIDPGKSQMAIVQADAFQRQNPIMGSEDPSTGQMLYLVGIEENHDECSPIEQSDAIERWDRKQMPQARPVDVVPGDNGLYSGRIAASLPLAANFDR